MKCQRSREERGQFKEQVLEVIEWEGGFRTCMKDLDLKGEVSHPAELLGMIVMMSANTDSAVRIGRGTLGNPMFWSLFSLTSRK